MSMFGRGRCRARESFGEVRVAEVALLIFTVLSGRRSCGVVITKFSDHVVTFRSSPTVFADTPMPASASTRILAGKPLSSAGMLLHLYRGIESPLITLSLHRVGPDLLYRQRRVPELTYDH
jgi:hypothetical protein